MDFDTLIERRGTHSSKWDKMDMLYGLPQPEALAMWTADSDYATAPCVIDAVRAAADHGVFGYSWPHPAYKDAICWWMKTRHGWDIDPDWILTSQGLGNAIAMSIQVFSDPGEGVAFFTPVYHEFSRKTHKTGRVVTELPLARSGDTYALDLDDAQARLTGREKVLLWCSPQNPSGRIWTADELRAVSGFAARNGMILISDEVHHDLVYPGEVFTPMDAAMPDGRAYTIYLTAASKTFNIAGQRTGQMIIPDPGMRKKIQTFQSALDYDPSALGVAMTMAAYCPQGAAWVDAQMQHLDANRKTFDAAINAIPGLWSMPLQSTYLAWVDFSATGMDFQEFNARIRDTALIGASPGPAFGPGGETFMRFNLATQSARVADACARITDAFADLQ